MRLRKGEAGEEQDGADRVDQEMRKRELALGKRRVGAVDEPEQHHRGEAHEIDVRVHRRKLEALVDAEPNAEGEAENAVKQPDQNEPAVDFRTPASSRTVSQGIWG